MIKPENYRERWIQSVTLKQVFIEKEVILNSKYSVMLLELIVNMLQNKCAKSIKEQILSISNLVQLRVFCPQRSLSLQTVSTNN